MFFSLVIKVYTAILNVNKKCVFPELGLLLLNIGLIVTIVVFKPNTVLWLRVLVRLSVLWLSLFS